MSRAFIPRHAQAGPRPPFGLLLVAGPELSDAIRVCQRAALRGWSTTIGPWDGREDAPETTAAKYCSAVRVIAQERLDCYLSLKLPALRFDRVLLETVLECASVHGVRVHFDSLGPETASDSLTLLERAARRHRNLSYTLPSRWRRSHDDADTILRLGIPVRVVKGTGRPYDATERPSPRNDPSRGAEPSCPRASVPRGAGAPS